jgi:hypothetical protein
MHQAHSTHRCANARRHARLRAARFAGGGSESLAQRRRAHVSGRGSLRFDAGLPPAGRPSSALSVFFRRGRPALVGRRVLKRQGTWEVLATFPRSRPWPPALPFAPQSRARTVAWRRSGHKGVGRAARGAATGQGGEHRPRRAARRSQAQPGAGPRRGARSPRPGSAAGPHSAHRPEPRSRISVNVRRSAWGSAPGETTARTSRTGYTRTRRRRARRAGGPGARRSPRATLPARRRPRRHA